MGQHAERSLSTLLVRADTYRAGSEVWMDDEAHVWVQAEVLKQENTLLTLRRKDSGETVEIDVVGVKCGCRCWWR